MSERIDVIQLDGTEVDTSEKVPTEVVPQRVIFSISLLIPCTFRNHLTRLFVVNYDPQTWNIWFPPYHFYVWKLPAATDLSYDELIQHAIAHCPSGEWLQPATHLPEAVKGISQFLSVEDLKVSPTPVVEMEPSLKYSKSKNQWTFYLSSYYMVEHVTEIEQLLNWHAAPTALLPILGPEFCSILTSSHYEGLEVVDNLVKLLKQQRHVELIHTKGIPVRS